VTWRVSRGAFHAGKGGHRYLELDEVQNDNISGIGGNGVTGVDMAGEEEGKTRGSGGEEEEEERSI